MDLKIFTIFISIYFIVSGLNHIIQGKKLEKYAVKRGVLNANQTVKMSALFLIIAGGALLIENVQAYAIYALSGFMFVSAIIMHKFWDETEQFQRTIETMNFSKNILIMILLLMVGNLLQN